MATLAGSEIASGVLRLTIGATMIAHGVRHGRSLVEGTARWFESIGFRMPKLQAELSSAVEICAGTALLLGAATPLAASAVVGTMAVAAHTVHRPNGFFITAEGYEYVLTIGVASTALAALGSGRFSVDHALGLNRQLSGARSAVTAIVVGLAGAAVQLKTFWTAPQDRPQDPAASNFT